MSGLIGVDGSPIGNGGQPKPEVQHLDKYLEYPVVVGLAVAIMADHRIIRPSGDNVADVRRAASVDLSAALGCLELARRYVNVVLATAAQQEAP